MSTTACNASQTIASTRDITSEVWIIVPAYNEGRRVIDTVQDLRRAFTNIVVIDDGSLDSTGALALRHTDVWVLRHAINSGQGAALQTGIDFALQRDAKIIVTFDADGQHSVDDIQRLIEPIVQGKVDVVLGSRFLGSTEGMPLSRWIVLKLAVLFTRVFSRIRVTDTHNGLRALSRTAAQQIRIKLNRMAHASEILDQIRQHHLKFRECPVKIKYTEDSLRPFIPSV